MTNDQRALFSKTKPEMYASGVYSIPVLQVITCYNDCSLCVGHISIFSTSRVETQKLISVFRILYCNFLPLTPAIYHEMYILFRYFTTCVLQIVSSELQGLTLYNLVNSNYTLYHSVVTEICPNVKFKETTLTHSVITTCKIGIDICKAS